MRDSEDLDEGPPMHRNPQQRCTDARARLEHNANVWLATASLEGTPHLIPLSLAWDGVHLLLATPTDSPTVNNALASGQVKATLDSADDVVLIDGSVEVVDFDGADASMIATYVNRVGWNPADQDGAWSLLVVTPRTIRAWNGVGEIRGRTIMRGGRWSDDPLD